MIQEFVTPSQVFEAIAYAKSKNPNDTYGDKAFNLNIKNIKPGNNNTRYLNFEILKKRNNGTWEFVPLNLKFTKLQTTSRILPPGHEKRKFPGAQLQFNSNASFETKKGNETITEEYGKAKIAIAEAFKRIVESDLDNKRLFVANRKITCPVQFDRVLDPVSGQREPLDKPIIRMEIKFEERKETETDPKKKNMSAKAEKFIDPSAKPKCEIYDATKRLSKGDPNYHEGELNFAPLVYEKDKKVEPLTYGNIGEVILFGSIVSGIDNMSNVVISSLGISLSSKALLLIVVPAKGLKTNITNIFSDDELYTQFQETTITDNVKDVSKDEYDEYSVEDI